MKTSHIIKIIKSKTLIVLLACLMVMLLVIIAGHRHRGRMNKIQPAQLRIESLYAEIISNSKGIQNEKYPVRDHLSDQLTQEVKFLDPRALKDDTEKAIIVLGDRPLGDTTPTVNMVYRVLKGVELAKKYPKAVMIMSGGATKGPIPEARMMGLIAWSRGVDPKRIILEDQSKTTDENAAYTAKIVGSKNIGQVFIINEPPRVQESVAIFQTYGKEFKNIQGVASDITNELIIEQMEQYLKTHDDRVVRGRLYYAKKGIKSKAYEFAVFQAQ